jgi:hypothetical protein
VEECGGINAITCVVNVNPFGVNETEKGERMDTVSVRRFLKEYEKVADQAKEHFGTQLAKIRHYPVEPDKYKKGIVIRGDVVADVEFDMQTLAIKTTTYGWKPAK